MRVLEGIDKGHEPAHAVRSRNGQSCASHAGHDYGTENVNKPRAPGYAHEKEKECEHDSAAEVRLQKEQEAEEACHQEGRQDTAGESFNQRLLGTHEIGKVHGQGYLHELHGLQVDRPEFDPAVGTVD